MLKPVRHPLARYLGKKGLKPEELAELAGVSRPSVYRAMAGHDIRMSIAGKISSATKGKVRLIDLLPTAKE